jgi:ADP-ribosylation factor-like protein 2
MGLYTILKKHRLKDRQLRLLFLGLDAAGKSTIVARLLSPDASPESALKDISPTLGFKISTIAFENYKLNICMLTAGCPDCRGCGRSKDSKGVLEELL